MYAEQVRLQQLDDEVRLRHILLETEEEAQEVFGLLEGGSDFTELAFERSDDIRTRLDGGSFGWVSPNQGWHIIKIDERRTRPPKTKDEMRPEIITFLTFTEISEILRELRAEADIQQRTQTPSGTPAPTLESPGE